MLYTVKKIVCCTAREFTRMTIKQDTIAICAPDLAKTLQDWQDYLIHEKNVSKLVKKFAYAAKKNNLDLPNDTSDIFFLLNGAYKPTSFWNICGIPFPTPET